MQSFAVTWSAVLAVTLVCSLVSAAASATMCRNVQCGSSTPVGKCIYSKHYAQQLSICMAFTQLTTAVRKRHSLIPACDLSVYVCTCVGNCSDSSRAVDVSFSACLVQEGSSTASVKTYTRVSCPCPSGSGDITIRVELPNGLMSTYHDLDTTPNPSLLNATQCDNGTQDSEPYSYCIKFADLTMAEDINTTKLVSEVTDALVLLSSQACLIIEFPGMIVHLIKHTIQY